ncbi:MAG: chemotaxis protein CheB [Pseudomonadota bacterium]
MTRDNLPTDQEQAPAPAPNHKQPTHYVGIGASAGGLEAIETFFSHMPAVSGFAFVVVQHLSPDYKSLMVELLSKKTEMPVLRAEDGMEVERDKVYLIPPKKNLTIFHGKLLLNEQDSARGLNLPIDIFLRSLAEDQGEKAVGVILSGTGSDGTRGTRSIKENGGMIMVQDEESAKFDGMPRAAISTGLADFILPPEEMPVQLLAFAKHPYTAKTERAEALLSDEDALTRIFALLREKSKVDFTYYKPSTVTRRIERRMSVNHFDDIRAYVEHLQEYPGEVLALYRELLIGVTNFFRDQEAFNLLSQKLTPELFNQKESREIRFWVAGCSTGEEAYTFAIIARECMEYLGKTFDVKIFATDVDRDAILKAGAGVYPASIAADLSPRLLGKYFHHKDDYFQIARHIREMVVFAQHNLIKDPPFTNIDLVSCRNLLIYLQPVLQRKVLELINFSLNPNGLLVLGTSETVGEMGLYFETISQKYKIFKSTGRMKPSIHDPGLLTAPDRKNRDYGAGHAGLGRRHRTHETDKTLERFLESISGDYVPLTLIVNEQMEVQHVFGETEGYFKVPSGRISNDISKMASKDLSIPLTTGIQKTFRTNEELRFTNIVSRRRDSANNVNLRIKPLPQKKGQEPLVAVFISETRKECPDGDAAVFTYDLSKEAEQRLRDLEQELQFTKENLQATIEELETSNEELQATNEELLASNEELQSTNEELQSTNEELHTVNAEYQNKIIELTELNNDVENLLSSSQIGTLLLDENLEIRKFSPQVVNIFKVLESDAGRPITHLNHFIANKDPYKIIRQVQETSIHRDKQILLHDGRWYLMRVAPYAIGPRKFSGIVISFVEISHIKAAQEALAKSEAELKQTARLAKVGRWEYDPATGVHKWSDEIFKIHDLEPGRQPKPEEGINYYAPEFRPIITEAFRKARELGEPYDLVLELITAKGRRRWVRAIGSPQITNGQVGKINGAFQDVTEFKEISEALRESEGKLKALFDILPVGVSILNREGEIVFYNPALAKILDLSPNDLAGGAHKSRAYFDVHRQPMSPLEFASARAIRENRAVYDVETGIATDDGEVAWVSVSAVPVDLPEWRVVVVTSDVNARKKAENGLLESERDTGNCFPP